MPLYEYKGIDKSGKEIKNTINVDSMITAKQKIRQMGIMLMDLKEKKSKQAGGGLNISFGSSVSVEDLAMMTRQLSTLVKAKIQIVEALGALEDQVEHPQLRIILSELKTDVNEGSSLADALKKHPKVFSNVYTNMVAAGEASGNLEVVLLRLADFTEAQMKLKNKIKGAMLYPVIMGVFGVLMMVVIFMFVIPKIAKIFISMKKELPLPTQLAIWISNFLQNYWWLLLISIVFSIWLFFRYINTEKGRRNWDTLLLKLPIIGGITKMINVSRFCSTLATLLNSGVPILASLTIVKNLIGNVIMQDSVENARVSVQEGASMVGPLKDSGQYPPMVTHMISLGERSGELEPMLKIISENYEDQVESKLNGLTATLEPLMMVGLGIGVAFIVAAVIVPMMNMNSIK
jgi:general secretion pathway protein F